MGLERVNADHAEMAATGADRRRHRAHDAGAALQLRGPEARLAGEVRSHDRHVRAQRVAGQLIRLGGQHRSERTRRKADGGAHHEAAAVRGQLEHRRVVGAQLARGGLRGRPDQVVERGARERPLAELRDSRLLPRPDPQLVSTALGVAARHRRPAIYSASEIGSPWRRDFSRSTAFVCSCDTRDSVTPSTSPISRRVRFS